MQQETSIPDGFAVTDPLLTLEQTAQYLNVTVRMVRRIIADNRLPAVRVGRHVRVRRSALERYIFTQSAGVR